MTHLALLLVAALGLEDGATPADPPALTSAAEPAQSPQPQGDQTRFKGRAVPKEQRAPVAYELASGRIVFKAQIAGREVWALLDTSASRSTIDIELARSAGLTLGAVEKASDTLGRGASVQNVSDVPILIPGQFEANHPRLQTVDLRDVSRSLDRKIEFVLAGDFLWGSAVYIDPSTQTFQLTPTGSFKPPSNAREVSLQKEGAPQIEITIGSEKAIVNIATGARGPLYLAPAAWQRIVPKDAKIGTVTVPGVAAQAPIRNVVLSEISIGSFSMRDVEARELPQPSATDGFLGMEVLGRFRIVLDVAAGKMWFGPAPPRVSK